MARTRYYDQLTPLQRKELARKGGLATSMNKEHMREIGRKGGLASAASKLKKKNLPSYESEGGLTAADINLRN